MNRVRARVLWAIVLFFALCPQSRADQPVFDEMPRWDGGWGVQLVQEYRLNRDLLKGTTPVGDDLREDVHILNIEGVYTWHKWIRATFKLPVILDARREWLTNDGERVEQRDRGLGNLTMTVPLKHYFNRDGLSGSFTFAPFTVAPLGVKDEYDVFRRYWSLGFSTGVEAETFTLLYGASLKARFYPRGERATLVGVHAHLGYNINVDGHSGHVKVHLHLHHRLDGTVRFTAGPLVYWKITDVWHVQAKWIHEFYYFAGEQLHGNGERFTLGAAVVF